MWKILLAFIAFAALALFILKKSGGDIDLGGEKHGADAMHAPATPVAASAPALVASAPASAASK